MTVPMRSHSWAARQRYTLALVALLVAGLAIRLLLTSHGVFRGDAQTFRGWAVRLVTSPLSSFYNSGGSTSGFRGAGGFGGFGGAADHLPGDLWFLWVIAHLYHLFSPTMDVQRFAFLVLIKLVPALADVGIGVLLYLIGRRFGGPLIGLLAAALWLLNPASIFLTAIWGQWDSVSAAFVLLALWLLLRGNPEWALPALTYASLIKPQFGLLFPIVAIVWWRGRMRPVPGADLPAANRRGIGRRLALAVVASVALFFLVDLPFSVGLPLMPTRWTIVERISYAVNRYTAVSENAFNLWPILAHAGGSRGVNDGLPFLLGLSYERWGMLLLGVSYLAVLVLLWRRPTRAMVLWAALATTFALFMLPTRIHERYLLPAVVLAVLVSAIAPHLRWLGVALSLTYLANIGIVYRMASGGGFGPGGQPSDLVVLGISAANLFLFLVVFVVGFTLARAPASEEEAVGVTVWVDQLRPAGGALAPGQPPAEQRAS